MTKESIPSRIRKYIDLKLENKETQESISNTNNKISNFKPKILRKLGYDQGLCWGSPSRMPEVARRCMTGAEGSEGRWKPEVTLSPEGQKMRPKVIGRSRRSLKATESYWSPKVIPSPEGPRELPKVQRGEWRSTADPKVTVNLRGSVSIMNRIG